MSWSINDYMLAKENRYSYYFYHRSLRAKRSNLIFSGLRSPKIRIVAVPIFLIAASLLLSPAPSLARPLTSIELIEKAYRNGRIGYGEALNYKVKAVLEPEGLPDTYRSRVLIKSGTPVILEARSNRHLLSPENTRLLFKDRSDTLIKYYGSGIELQSFMSRGRRFRIHYTTDNKYGDAVPTTDDNGNNIPDYVDRFADILDHVWTREIDGMGYDAPPSDEKLGGDCLLDVYLADLQGFYGLTQIDTGMPASTVYMIFENDYSDGFPSNTDPAGQQEGDMKVTAAHEFFHTIHFQISEDTDPDGCCLWWMEASATWMEDYVYPEVNDYVNYIGEWFKRPDLPLNTANGRFEYGTTVWVKHLTERYGSRFVYDVWKRIKDGDTALTGVEKELIGRGTTLKDEVEDLRVANVTFTYDDGQVYQAWAVLNETEPIGVSYNWPCTDLTGIENFPGVSIYPLAARYYCFSAPGGPGSLDLDFAGNGDISVMIIGVRSTDSGYDVTEMVTDGNNNGSITLNGFSSDGPYDRVVVIPLNYSTTTQSSFSLSASYSSATNPNSPATIEIIPLGASIVTGDGGLGKQQYFLILRDVSGKQVLESGTGWTSNSLSVSIDNNGLATASDAATATITASLGNLSHGTGNLSSSKPVSMTPGVPRNCSIKSSDGRCFIATAAFGSPFHPYVEILREFRDRYLLTNSVGENIVSIYYSYSPFIAEDVAKYTILRSMVQICLIPGIIFAVFMVKITISGKIAIGVLLVIVVLYGWVRKPLGVRL